MVAPSLQVISDHQYQRDMPRDDMKSQWGKSAATWHRATAPEKTMEQLVVDHGTVKDVTMSQCHNVLFL